MKRICDLRKRPCFSWLDVPKALFGVSHSVAQLDGDSEKFGRWLFDALAREGSCAVPHDLEQTCKTMRQAWGGSAQSLFCEHPEWEGRIGRGSRAQERLGEEVGRRRGRLAESIALKPKSQKSDSIVRNASRAEHAMGMAPDRETVLARRWREEGDEDALRELTRAYMRLSIAMAARFRRYGLSMSDLVQEANVGLMQAAARFRPSSRRAVFDLCGLVDPLGSAGLCAAQLVDHSHRNHGCAKVALFQSSPPACADG
jgi:hypothetical protein